MPAPRWRRVSPDWMPGGILISILCAVDARHGDRAAERGGGEAHRAFGDQGRALALEDRVPLHVDENVEVAAGGAANAALALAGDADAGAFVDPGGNVDVELAALDRPALAVAGRAGIGDGLARAEAGRAAALDDEEALLGADLAGAAAGAAALGAAFPARAASLAALAAGQRLDRDRLVGAGERLFQRSFPCRSASRRRGRRSGAARAGP